MIDVDGGGLALGLHKSAHNRNLLIRLDNIGAMGCGAWILTGVVVQPEGQGGDL